MLAWYSILLVRCSFESYNLIKERQSEVWVMSFFGIGWIGVSLIALFLFTVIVVFLTVERFIWLPKESTIIKGARNGKGGPQS